MCACVCDEEAQGEKRIVVSPESELQSFRNRIIATLVKGKDRVATMAPLQVSISSTIMCHSLSVIYDSGEPR